MAIGRLGHLFATMLLIGACATVSKAAVPSPNAVNKKLGGLSVPFIENAGQHDPRVRFTAPMFAGTLFVTADGELVYSLPVGRKAESDSTTGEAAAATKHRHQLGHTEPTSLRRATLIESFVGGNANPSAGMPHVTKVSQFVGNNPEQHGKELRTFEHVSLGEVFAGVDVRLRATGRNVEKIFTVRPREDPATIRMALAGAGRLSVDENGSLRVNMADGDVLFRAPIAYQTIGGTLREVPVAYRIDGATNQYRFAVGTYDRTLPLVIDPVLQATYLGGGATETIHAMTVHPTTGDVIVAGETESLNFPCVLAAGGCANGGDATTDGLEGFVARLNANLTALLQATYFGGSGSDIVRAIAVHPASGEVLIAGYTTSNNLPCTTVAGGCSNGAQPNYQGNGYNAFAARFNSSLTTLLQATYHGSGDYVAIALAIHPATGDVLIGGRFGGFGLIASFDASLTNPIASIGFAGNSETTVTAIAVDPASGDVILGGVTNHADFPCTKADGNCANGAQPDRPGGGYDGFLMRFNADLVLLQSTYLGTGAEESLTALFVHPISGDVYAAGSTTAQIFPCAGSNYACGPAGAQSISGGGYDGFITRLSGNLRLLIRSSFVGGETNEFPSAIALHPNGEIYVAGDSLSPTIPFSQNGAQANNAGGFDGFIARFSTDLSTIPQTTLFGGGLDDVVKAMAVHPTTGEVYIAGSTASTNLPCVTAGNGCGTGARTTKSGTSDGFVARFTPDLTAADKTPNPFAFAPIGGAPVSTLLTSSPVQLTGMSGSVSVYVEGQMGSAYCISSTNACTCDVSTGFVSVPGTMANNQYVCVRHFSAPIANAMTSTVFHAGGGSATFRVGTGAVFGGCALDVDGNTIIDALTDGLMLLRAMFGLTGTSVTTNAIGMGATRSTWAQVRSYLNGNCATNFAQ